MSSRVTAEDLRVAVHRSLPDIVRRDLTVLFCGINPGLYSAAIGAHFGRPGNRFWPTLHGSGFTPRRLDPLEQRLLLELGCGITNLVPRPTARAEELTRVELLAGRARLERLVAKYRPRYVAVLGLGAYRTAFAHPDAGIGPASPLGTSLVWVLPNPSGLNAHFSAAALTREFARLRHAAFAGVRDEAP